MSEESRSIAMVTDASTIASSPDTTVSESIETINDVTSALLEVDKPIDITVESPLLPLSETTELPLVLAPPSSPVPPPYPLDPPSYATVMRTPGRTIIVYPSVNNSQDSIDMRPSAPFIAPYPPPTYAESEDICMDIPTGCIPEQELRDFRLNVGTIPIPTICPRCGQFIFTATHTHRSSLTHVTALLLCVCGCWPCCLLPYCLPLCKVTYHHCPVCAMYLGAHVPLFDNHAI